MSMKYLRLLAATSLLSLVAVGPRALAQSAPAPASRAAGAVGATNAPFWTGIADATAFETAINASVHPDEQFRKAAERVFQKVSTAATKRSLDRGAYDAISKVDASGADAETISSHGTSRMPTATSR
jgi:hypothetical protein